MANCMGRIDAPPAKRLRCATLATGMKCLTKQKVASGALSGNVLHDCHAEMLALRAFNRFLLDECRILARKSEEDKSQDSRPASEAETVVEWRRVKEEQHTDDLEGLDGVKGPFKIKATVKLHMYCSEAPCGDASMELTMAAQEDATPWTTPSTSAANTNVQEHLAIPERDATGNPGTDTLTTSREFSFSRRTSGPGTVFVASNLCTLAYGSNQETLINGVIQGRKQGDPRGASTVSRRKMWQSAKEVAELAEIPSRALVKYTYGELKSDIGLETRGRVKSFSAAGH
ncbi:hypothetical protein H2203_004948 [Taxawa tesnikishii (nom. ined.)]|nr:hypothetical protein H2203_004948 [Dothideales sp. JES 119]